MFYVTAGVTSHRQLPQKHWLKVEPGGGTSFRSHLPLQPQSKQTGDGSQRWGGERERGGLSHLSNRELNYTEIYFQILLFWKLNTNCVVCVVYIFTSFHTGPLQVILLSFKVVIRVFILRVWVEGLALTHCWEHGLHCKTHKHTHFGARFLRESFKPAAAGLVTCSQLFCLHFSHCQSFFSKCCSHLCQPFAMYIFCSYATYFPLGRGLLTASPGILQYPNALGAIVQFENSGNVSFQAASIFPRACSLLSGQRMFCSSWPRQRGVFCFLRKQTRHTSPFFSPFSISGIRCKVNMS